MKILILGVTGLLGNAIFRILSQDQTYSIFGTIRDNSTLPLFNPALQQKILMTKSLEDQENIEKLFQQVKPDVVINCLALPKNALQEPNAIITIFALLPRRLAYFCRMYNARLIHMSTDCVFDGTRGDYTEEDIPNPTDSYGIAKLLGEINEPNAITIRTSLIGHEITPRKGLLEWFLMQNEECKGYPRAIFSGFPNVVLAQIIKDEILPRPDLQGIYHLATRPISKLDLLTLIAKQYRKSIQIIPDEDIIVNRSLCADRFNRATGYVPPEWPELIKTMYSEKFS